MAKIKGEKAIFDFLTLVAKNISIIELIFLRKHIIFANDLRTKPNEKEN